MNKNTFGFTILEILIVIAVMGAITAVVFIAIPGLQRNNRNAQREDDISNIAAAITGIVNNNKGKTVTSTEINAIKTRAQPFKQFTVSINMTVTVLSVASQTLAAVTDFNTVAIVTAANCEPDGSAKYPTTGNKRTTVLLYAFEGANGPISKCLQV
ncbi:MAG: type II secretion system protein [Patescibacteria group bacterium]